MNVVPTIAKKNILGVIYETCLIGIYHDWYAYMKEDLLEFIMTGMVTLHFSFNFCKALISVIEI